MSTFHRLHNGVLDAIAEVDRLRKENYELRHTPGHRFPAELILAIAEIVERAHTGAINPRAARCLLSAAGLTDEEVHEVTGANSQTDQG
jgi:hypothetical protein